MSGEQKHCGNCASWDVVLRTEGAAGWCYNKGGTPVNFESCCDEWFSLKEWESKNIEHICDKCAHWDQDPSDDMTGMCECTGRVGHRVFNDTCKEWKDWRDE